MNKSTIGVYGLGVMGSSIALNMLNHGYQVSLYNYQNEVTTTFMKERITTQNAIPCLTLNDFVNSLESPRKILIMVTAGEAVDCVISELRSLLSVGDILIDGGNSYYKDTISRHNDLEQDGINYLGIGVSGGEMGALLGPSIMPSGNKAAYDLVEPILKDIAAKASDGKPCCSYIGKDGAGHYVKMVHNGIEYADIQIICEAYDVMRHGLNMSLEEIKDVFTTWNKGKLKSYLIEITAKILTRKDELSENYLIDMILDTAGEKGTGKWTSIESLTLGVCAPTIAESVFARYMSAKKVERVTASKHLSYKPVGNADKNYILSSLEDALYAAKICCYAQGFNLLKYASDQNNWDLNYGEIAMVWREGCIIRAQFLEEIKVAYEKEKFNNLLCSTNFSNALLKSQKAWRDIIIFMIEKGIYAPAFMSTLAYFDGYRSEQTSANLLQAQRDYFGAHMYQRIDREGSFHTIWE